MKVLEQNSHVPPAKSYSFFLLQRRPPTSTLFPYTTLFRSSTRSTRAGSCMWDLDPRDYTDAGSPDRDRKSTRLNSSHQIISYAVFCLKKKKEELFKNINNHISKAILFNNKGNLLLAIVETE